VARRVAVNVLLLALLLTFSRGAVLGLAGAALAVLIAGGFGRLRGVARSRWTWLALANAAVLFGLFFTSTSTIDALRVTTGTDQTWYRAAFAGSPPARMMAGEMLKLPVTVKNLSPLTWTSAKPGDYALSYHWLYPSLRIARFDTTLVFLPALVPHGAQRTVIADLVAPEHPGKYLLVWDLLWHHTTWFDLKTGRLAPHPVSVVGPAALAPDPPDAFSQPGDGSLVYLPIIRTESRRSVWNVGWHSFLHRPLFGGGQHAIRADYASETSPAPGQPAPSHAHNLLLELLDNWGVVGTVLLATLLAALWWPLVAATFHRRVLSRWHIALLAAAFALLAHETVDYFLGSTSVFVLVWILTGLASAGLADETSPSVIPSNSSNARDPRR